MNDLITLRNDKLLVSTNIIAKNCNVEHRAVLQLIKTHRIDIEYFGILIEDKEKIPKGRPLSIFLLNEEQFTFLMTLMQNSKIVVKAKKAITKEFFRMKKALLHIELNRKNQEWIEQRKKGKESRKEFTAAIKELLDEHIKNNPKSTYAKKPNLLYSNITKMLNKALFDIQITAKNKRDYMSEKQLAYIDVAEIHMLDVVHKCLEDKKDAKETYKILQKEIEPYAKWIGKTPIIDLLTTRSSEQIEEK